MSVTDKSCIQQCIAKFELNMQGFLPYSASNVKFAVAVSGGVDSMCMLELARIWANVHQAKVFVITVDHGLREFSGEKNLVESFCRKNSLFMQILKWNHQGKIESNIQAKARKARYKLISDFCKQNDIFYVLIGHHAQDFIENFALRLARKSGPFAFSVDKISIMNDVVILRPMFNFTKDECENFLTENGINWVEDPTNKDKKFIRNNIRVLLESFNSITTKFSLLALDSIFNISSSLSIIQEAFLEAFLECIITSCFGYIVLKLEAAKKRNIQLQYLLFYYAMIIVRGADNVPRMHKVIALYRNIIDQKITEATLHGTKICVLSNKCVIIYRLFGLEDIFPTILGNELIWDKRFRFSYSIPCDQNKKLQILVARNKTLENVCIKEKIKNICEIENNNYISFLKKNDIKEFIKSFPILETDGCKISPSFSNNGIIFFIDKLKIHCTFYTKIKPKILYLPFCT